MDDATTMERETSSIELPPNETQADQSTETQSPETKEEEPEKTLSNLAARAAIELEKLIAPGYPENKPANPEDEPYELTDILNMRNALQTITDSEIDCITNAMISTQILPDKNANVFEELDYVIYEMFDKLIDNPSQYSQFYPEKIKTLIKFCDNIFENSKTSN